jgi:hypothetical protein
MRSKTLSVLILSVALSFNRVLSALSPLMSALCSCCVPPSRTPPVLFAVCRSSFLLCPVFSLLFAGCSLLCPVCSLLCPGCCLLFVVCSLLYPFCSLLFTVCSQQLSVLCSLLSALCLVPARIFASTPLASNVLDTVF